MKKIYIIITVAIIAFIYAILVNTWPDLNGNSIYYDDICHQHIDRESFHGEVRVLKLKEQLTLGSGQAVPSGLKSRLGCFAEYLEMDKLERSKIPDILHSDQQSFVNEKNIDLEIRARVASPAFYTRHVRYLVEVRNGDRHFLFVCSSGSKDAPERAPLNVLILCRDQGIYKMWSDSNHPSLRPIIKTLKLTRPFDCESLLRKEG